MQNDSAKIQHISGEKLDEELTVARLYISKLKSEVKNVVQRSSQLEAAQLEGTQKLDEMEKSLSDNRLLVQQVCITHMCNNVLEHNGYCCLLQVIKWLHPANPVHIFQMHLVNLVVFYCSACKKFHVVITEFPPKHLTPVTPPLILAQTSLFTSVIISSCILFSCLAATTLIDSLITFLLHKFNCCG